MFRAEHADLETSIAWRCTSILQSGHGAKTERQVQKKHRSNRQTQHFPSRSENLFDGINLHPCFLHWEYSSTKFIFVGTTQSVQSCRGAKRCSDRCHLRDQVHHHLHTPWCSKNRNSRVHVAHRRCLMPSCNTNEQNRPHFPQRARFPLRYLPSNCQTWRSELEHKDRSNASSNSKSQKMRFITTFTPRTPIYQTRQSTSTSTPALNARRLGEASSTWCIDLHS